MSEVESTSGATEKASGETQDVQSTSTKPDAVSYESHKKLLGEKKKLQQQFEEMQSHLQQLTTDKLSAEGKKDELIDSLKKRASTTEEKLNKAVSYFANRAVTSALREEALKAGCINVDDLIKLSDLSLVEVSEDFEVGMDQVRQVVEEAKKSRGYLFNSKAPSVKTGTPNGKVDSETDWKSLPPVEQAKLAMKMMNKN
jgi:hypothetical protein